MKIIFPNTNYEIKNYYQTKSIPQDGPLFFLAGPILGGGNWQIEACRLIKKLYGNQCVIACPSRFPPHEPLYYHGVQGLETSFEDQLQWEQYYMDKAAMFGCIIFWLPAEDRQNPRNDGNPYAMMTRDELGAWRMKVKYNPLLRIVIGGEKGFPGLAEIQRYNDLCFGEGRIPICTTLEETIKEALMLLYGI